MSMQVMKVLLIEDATNWRDLLQQTLEELDCQVTAASSFAQAIAALDTGPFDLAIVDVRLVEGDEDDISGLALIKQAWFRQLVDRFVVLSAFAVKKQVYLELGQEVPYQIVDKADISTQQFKDNLKLILLREKRAGFTNTNLHYLYG